MVCEMDNLQLIDFSEEDDCLIPFPFRDSPDDIRLSETLDNVNVCDFIKLFRGVNSHVHSESPEPRRLSFLRKSIDWDSVFFNSAGLLNPEELSVINTGYKKDEFNLSSYGAKKHIGPLRVAGQDHISSNSDVLEMESLAVYYSKNVKPHIHKLPKGSKISINISENMGNKTRRAGADLTLSKGSPKGDLSSKSTSLTCATTEKNSKAHRSNESSFSASPKRKNNLKSTKLTASPSSVLSPLSSTCSFSTSPARSSHNAILASDLQSARENIDERKFTSQHVKRSSIGKVKSSCLRVPSPKIGFFDEEQPIFKGRAHGLNKFCPSNHSPFVSTENCSKVKKILSREHDGRIVGTSCSKRKTNGQIPKQISKNRMNIERKSRKDDSGMSQGKAMIDIKKKQDRSDQRLLGSQKENACGFEVNGLTHYRDVTEVKGQKSRIKPGQPSLPPTAATTTSCSRTVFAEKMFEPKGPSFWCKSLDWDSAFFTSGGLLNPEELSMINEGLMKAESNPPTSGT